MLLEETVLAGTAVAVGVGQPRRGCPPAGDREGLDEGW